uniref:Solute carrier family 12 member 2 n=1 Tax=Plectus sambesii TaxID=2011161 RepID=A0A914VZI6_9BILA
MADSIDSESNPSSYPDGFRVESVPEGDNSTGYQRGPDSVSSLSSVGRFQIASLKDTHESNAIHISVSSSSIGNQRKESFGTGEICLADEKNMRNMLTIERPPAIDFYLNLDKAEGCSSSRPSMIALVHGNSIDSVKLEIKNSSGDHLGEQRLAAKQINNVEQPVSSVARVKFGWIEGVFVRCILNILGVMLYLRISWVTGQAGIGLGSIIVVLASVVTTITTISLCAICTNGEVKGGGAYFVISRTLGPEFGGSIGLIFSMANTIGAAMYVVGFAETVRDLMKEKGWIIIDNGIMDIRIIGLITCTLLMAIVFIGTSFESRMQIVLLFILIASIISYWTGTFLPVTEHQELRGVTGYNFGTLTTNFLPAWRGEDFFSVFAVYFPAATGIMAGANISGDLADPQKAIPKGTLLAIAVTTTLYLLTIWQTGATCVRDADGLSPPLFSNESSLKWIQPDCVYNATCEYGLMNYFQVMEIESGWGPLITAGIFAATLSSALASLVSAPKVFQAVCKDHLFPYIHYFSKGYGKDDEPRRAYCLGYIIAMLMILLGDLNAIAPIISNFFLASYALINYACFDASFVRSTGFRPSFKYYNMWLSLGGAFLCMTVMFIISWWTALITFVCFAMLILYILHRKPDVNWGSSTQAHSYNSALKAMLKLRKIEEHVKNYRPQILVLTGNPASRPSFVNFANNITKGSSLLICGHVISELTSNRTLSLSNKPDERINEWLRKRRVKAFYVSTVNSSLRSGVHTLMQAVGLGKLRPNIILLGFKTNWAAKGRDGLDEVNEYFGVIQDSFSSNMAVGVLRNAGGGLDYSELMMQHNVGDVEEVSLTEVFSPNKIDRNNVGSPASLCNNDSKEATIHDEKAKSDSKSKNNKEDENNQLPVTKETPMSEYQAKEDFQIPVRRLSLGWNRRETVVQRELMAMTNRFQRKIKRATVDVWWLYDDGGLTLLIPHLLTVPKSYLENAKLRVFTVASSRSSIELEQRSMASLLSKFRIEFADVIIIPDITKEPHSATLADWEKLIAPFLANEKNNGNHEGLIQPSEQLGLKTRIYRQLRCRELLLQHSSNADLIVVTLPVPRKGIISSYMYMAWLEMLTRDLPPTLLIRGNQTSVLTLYS